MEEINYEKNLLKKLAEAWNNLDIKLIENFLAEDVIYESQMVLSDIQGKEGVLNYYQNKFNAVRESKQSKQMTVTAEMAVVPSLENRHCIVLTQKAENINRGAVILIKAQDNKVRRIDLCIVPSPAEAVLSGEIPL